MGKEKVLKIIVGSNSLHIDSNDNGKRVIDFAAFRNMIVMSMQFSRKGIYKCTQMSDRRTHNQIDHVLTDKRGASSIMNIHRYRGANCHSNHYLVGIKYRCRISSRRNNCQHRLSYNVDKLQRTQKKEKGMRNTGGDFITGRWSK